MRLQNLRLGENVRSFNVSKIVPALVHHGAGWDSTNSHFNPMEEEHTLNSIVSSHNSNKLTDPKK